MNQVNICRKNGKVDGSIYFRAKAFVSNHQNFQKTMNASIYKYPSLVPAMNWIDSIPPSAPLKLKAKVKEDNVVLKWKAPKYRSVNDSATYYVVYRFEENEVIDLQFSNKIVSIQKQTEFIDSSATSSSCFKPGCKEKVNPTWRIGGINICIRFSRFRFNES